MSPSPRIRSILFALLFLAVCLGLTLRAERLGETGPFRWYDRLIVSFVAPPARLIGSARTQVITAFHRYLYLVGVSEENTALRKQMEEEELQRTFLSERERENERLRNLLDLQKSLSGETIAARVVTLPPLGDFRLAVIDKGSGDGIERRDPVIAVGGLVGQVLRVAPHFSQVLLITDPTSAVDGRVVKTGGTGGDEGVGARGLVIGRARRLDFQHELFLGTFEFLTRTSQLAAGDSIETTGLDGIFPPGIPIGEVHEVTQKKYDVFLGAEIIPRVDFNQLREVLVVKRR